MGDVCETGCRGLVNMPKVETRGVSWGRGREKEGLWRRKKKGGLVKGDKELFFWCAYESERADAKLFIKQHLYDPLW